MLVWEDAAKRVWISYNSPEYLQKRHVFQKTCQMYLYFTNWHPEEPNKSASFLFTWETPGK